MHHRKKSIEISVIILAQCLSLCLLIPNVHADGRDIVIKNKDGFELKTKDGDYSIAFGGRVHYDYNRFDGVINKTESQRDSDMFFRRARLQIDGNIHNWGYKLSYNLTDGGSLDVLAFDYEGWGDLLELSIGQQKEGFGLEDTASSNWITTIERSMPTNAFSVDKNLGIRLHGANRRITYSIGAFKENVEVEKDSLDHAYTGRLVYRFLGGKTKSKKSKKNKKNKIKNLLHVGAGFTVRDGTFDGFSARLGSRGGDDKRANKILAEYDQGAQADKWTAWNIETAAIVGPFHIISEYFKGKQTGIGAAPDIEARGYYVQAGWLITGERRQYKISSATVRQVDPKRAFGAFELIARMDYLDVTDSGRGRFTTIDGEKAKTITLGINWFLNSYVKVAANIVRAKTDEKFGGFDEGDALNVRLQLSY